MTLLPRRPTGTDRKSAEALNLLGALNREHGKTIIMGHDHAAPAPAGSSTSTRAASPGAA
jgi:hypothetical protein